METNSRVRLFNHPFSREYWQEATSEFKNLKVLIFAALMVALRIIFKNIRIPLAPGLNIYPVSFFVNAFGAMVFGPVVAILGAIISDTLGFIVANDGGFYFLPFVLPEIAGSVIYALFLYRSRLSTLRVTLSVFCVNVLVNVAISSPIWKWYYAIYNPKKVYIILDAARITKNLVMVPIQAVLLVFFFKAVIPPFSRVGYICGDVSQLCFTKRNIIILALLTLVGIVAVILYINYGYMLK